jgi:2-oxoglutarate ferredoxin oxidoreductase subunit gamma
MKCELICSGFGGQGSLTIGKFLAKAGMQEGKNVTWLPSYGPEMRGGTANVAVVISDKSVASPLVSAPDILIALNQPSLDKFGPMVKPGGFIVANADMCPRKLERDDVEAVYIPMSDIAKQAGSMQVVNVVSIGSLLACRPIVSIQTIVNDLTSFLKTKNPALLEANLKAIELGAAATKK